ncbi:hypothetical protein CVT24_010511 [Panaeolus cyanescens]|uniref:Cytochrome P450 n=1 Tax=Panaeolus cyanescens TaxID=181874 RepID=A0A409YVW8_9AGAR|nr:hypothetical protein CVT24_010511 [Panaeolus cyanescens]
MKTNFVHEWGYEIYKGGWDVRSVVTMMPVTGTFLFFADAAVAKEVSTYRARFPKPMIFYEPLTFFGQNIVASEGEQWKKYRKISAPAFTEITLFVISCAGFGHSISWANDSIPSGHKMSFKDAMQIMSITKRTKNAGQALVELKTYMSEMIHGRLHSDKVERHDLFSILLEENSQHLDSAALTDDELFGNIFIYLVAGHETTSHSMAFALGLLALYPDEQEKLLQQIRSVLKDGLPPTYEDVSSLTYALAVFYETLRLYPPVGAVPKISEEDTSLTITNAEGQVKRVPVPKGIYIDIHIAGIHKNPRYWSDPEMFKPARFLESNWPRDAFFPFSAGSRACLGRRFAEIEAIAALTLFILKYEVTIKEEPQFANETFEERKARVMASDFGISLTPLRVPLVFTRR